jgi:hypothetical protein
LEQVQDAKLDIVQTKPNKMKKLTDKETFVIYAGLTNALVDHIENDFRQSIYNKQSLKFKSQNLLKELVTITDKLYEKGSYGDAVDQHVMAGDVMLKFFKLGMIMADMDDVRHEGLNTQLNILLKSYGLDIDF